MYRNINKKFSFLLAASLFVNVLSCFAISQEARSKGFVYLHEIEPTIMVSLRYITHENFVANPVKGYKKPVVMMTKQAALALKKVQDEVKKDGLSLVVYD